MIERRVDEWAELCFWWCEVCLIPLDISCLIFVFLPPFLSLFIDEHRFLLFLPTLACKHVHQVYCLISPLSSCYKVTKGLRVWGGGTVAKVLDCRLLGFRPVLTFGLHFLYQRWGLHLVLTHEGETMRSLFSPPLSTLSSTREHCVHLICIPDEIKTFSIREFTFINITVVVHKCFTLAAGL